jgi:hypothetical protein
MSTGLAVLLVVWLLWAGVYSFRPRNRRGWRP